MRAGGGAAVAAARELGRLAQAGQVSRAELTEAQEIVAESPELRDAFGEAAREFTALGGGDTVRRDVKALRPDTRRLTEARGIPERFMADLTTLQHQVLDPRLSRSEKAERLFQFFEGYAGRFVELNAAHPLKDAELQKALAQFDKALDRAGFQHLVAGDGRTGTQAARDMLQAKSAADLAAARPTGLDAPGWKDNVAERNAQHVEQRRAELPPGAVITPQLRTQAQQTEEEKQKGGSKREKSRSGVLGGKMVWNVLHFLRGDDLTDVQRKDALQQLAIVAGLVLVFIAVIVAVLVSV
jgi:hypothetical protein